MEDGEWEGESERCGTGRSTASDGSSCERSGRWWVRWSCEGMSERDMLAMDGSRVERDIETKMLMSI